MLSPRILDYSSHELWWVCANAVLYDGGEDAPLSRADNRIQKPSFESLQDWRSVVQDYTRRFLTFPSDKLPAISGVAAEYGKTFGQDAYLAGLWKSDLVTDLLWSTTHSDISRPPLQRAPSWSWAALDGEINYHWCSFPYQKSLIIIDCRVSPVSAFSPYGAVDPLLCSFKVQGKMKLMYWTLDKQYLLDPAYGYDRVGRTHGDAEEVLPEEEVLDKGELYPVWVLIVTYNAARGLLLVEMGGNRFRRVGMFFRLWGGLEEFRMRSIEIL